MFYIGHTDDLRRRFEEHNNGKVASTRNRRPFLLLYYEACLNRSDAVKREKYFKTGFGRRFLKNRLYHYSLTQARDGGRGDRQKVVVKKIGKRLVIEDWKK